MSRDPAETAVRLRAAAALLAERRDGEAAAACREMLAHDPGSVAALHLLGVALTRLGQPHEAIEVLRRATQADPRSAACQLALGNALRQARDLGGALQAFERAHELDPANAAAAFNLAEQRAEQGDLRAAARLLARVATANPMDFAACQRLVDRLAELALRPSIAAQPRALDESQPNGAGLRSVTIGFCSVQPEREARARESLGRAFRDVPHDFIVVRDARSLAEGFNRIVDAAQGEHLVLCHDDIEILSPALGAVLALALAQADLVGVAGAARVSGPAVLWAGHPHVHGWVSYPRGDDIEAAPLSLRRGLVSGVQALDGVFMAMLTATARRLRFDAATFDGFHFYDLDFSYRAHLDGLRLAVSTDILLLHASEGKFAQDWQRFAARFQAKYPQLRGAQGSPHWYGAKLPSRAHVLRFYDLLREHATTDHAT